MGYFISFIVAVIAAMLLYYSCRHYVRHFNFMSMSSRRKRSLCTLTAAGLCLILISIYCEWAIIYHIILMLGFGCYATSRIKYHKNCILQHGADEDDHQQAATNYQSWLWAAAVPFCFAIALFFLK